MIDYPDYPSPRKLDLKALSEALGSRIFMASQIDYGYVDGLVVYGEPGEPIHVIDWHHLEKAMRRAGRLKRPIYISQPDTNVQRQARFLRKEKLPPEQRKENPDDVLATLLNAWPSLQKERDRVADVKEEVLAKHTPQILLRRVESQLQAMEQVPLAPRCEEFRKAYERLQDERERLKLLVAQAA